MMQQLKDLAARMKGEKKVKVIAGVVVVAILASLFMGGNQPRRTGVRRPEARAPKLVDTKSYDDLMSRMVPELEAAKAEQNRMREELAKTNEQIKENSERTAEIFKKLLEKMQQQTAANTTGGGAAMPVNAGADMPPPAVDVPDAGSLGGGAQMSAELDSFGSVDQTGIAPPLKPGLEKVAFVGAGDSVRVKLLAGVNAPTDGTPYPVLMKLISDIYGPDGSVLPVGEARIIAAAQGSITDARALVRITSLNLRLPDGRHIVRRVDGWVVGEDGIRGLPGVLIDPLGKAIGGAILAGGVQGFGSALEVSNSTTSNDVYTGIQNVTVTGSPWEYAAGRGIREGANQWSDLIKKRVEQMVPVVQVYSGREATAIFARSVSIPSLYDALENSDESME